MRKIKAVIFIILMIIPVLYVWPDELESSDVSELGRFTGEPVRIITVQRGNFQGVLKDVNDEWVEVIGKDGQILFIDLESVDSYIVFSEEVEKDTFFQDSASNRLIVMPTGFPMETGEFHVADQEIAAVTMSYGLNEYVSFWSGISIPGFVLNARFIASFAPTFAVSVGSFAGISWFTDDDGAVPGVIIPYCLASWGEPDNNITVGAGPAITFNVDEVKVWDVPGIVCVLGGKKVLTSSTSLIFENWIIWTERRVYDSMDPIPVTAEIPVGTYSDAWSAVPAMIFPAICFRIAGARLSWDIGAVVPLMILNDEEVVINAGTGEWEDNTYYRQNTVFRLTGFADDVIIPIPILSVTYRID